MVISLGTINAGYLLWKHQKQKQNPKQPLVCPLNHDCSVVTESRWSHIFWIRNETLGVLFFLSMFLAVLSMIIVPSLLNLLALPVLLAAGGSILFSIILILIQAFVIKDYCFYCIISAILTVIIFINSYLLVLK
ncbi:MAG: vitamin K epoxide reductase family protein [archaeon]|nr:vitamin K epoxide reductase family protein [archaeon]